MSDFKEKIRTIQFAGKSPTITRDQQFTKDRDAYARLRREGLQPPQIDGAADLEKRASTKLEVDMGHLFNKEDLKKAEEGIRKAEDIRFGLA